MKQLKFREHLIPIIISGEKTVTWRLFDDKDLQVGDEIKLINSSNEEMFATAKIISLMEKKLGEVDADDYEGHENFENQEAMYEQYREYYGPSVGKDTLVKVIGFELSQASRIIPST